MPHPLNGIRVGERRGNTIFIPLPRALWTPIGDRDEHRRTPCRCENCAKVPGRRAYWDTLAIVADPSKSRDHGDYTWTVHAPEMNPDRLRGTETRAYLEGPSKEAIALRWLRIMRACDRNAHVEQWWDTVRTSSAIGLPVPKRAARMQAVGRAAFRAEKVWFQRASNAGEV